MTVDFNFDKDQDFKLITSGVVPEYRQTLYNSFRASLWSYGESTDCLGVRETVLEDGKERLVGSHFYSYSEVLQKVDQIGSSLASLGLQKGDRVGICSYSRMEWMLLDLACSRQGFVLVPLYDSVPLAETVYIAKDSGIKILFIVSKRFSYTSSIIEATPSLEHIVLFDFTPLEKVFAQENANYKTCSKPLEVTNCFSFLFSEFESLALEIIPPADVDFHDLCTLVYTSGTTGFPKGAMITQCNLLHGATTLMCSLPPRPYPEFRECIVSYLPLAHIFERAAEHALLSVGSKLGYYSGDITTLMEDIQLFQPTMLLGVPRVYTKVFNAAMKNVEGLSALKGIIFRSAFARKYRVLQEGGSCPFLDKLLFKKGLHAKLGGQLRSAFSGSAPLPPNVQSTLEVLMCCPIANGYATTETSSAGSVSRLGEPGPKNGNVGKPSGLMNMKLVDVPEMGYVTSTVPPRGEVYISGPAVCQGYWNQPEKTAEAFVTEEDGTRYYRTGDIGMFDEEGRLILIDRKSCVVKSPQGEFVQLTTLSDHYAQSQFVEQIHLVGGQIKLIAIVSVPVELLPSDKDPDVWVDLEAKILADFSSIAKEKGLRSFEQVGAVYVSREVWTPENGCLTASMKVKKAAILTKYADIISDIVNTMNTAPLSAPICCPKE
ncbi:hypothetical protein RCL1_005808 [Eukaryota sp. TZLM3-RCL]